ncbi:MAG: RtcB family protein [Planctomycetes bacterium]|nr:RtcB family protein [Planctomycetota bacterium]
MKTLMEVRQAVPIYCWAERVDKKSMQILKRLARWDRLAGPIAVMPDIHFSGDVCVGTVLVTETCVLPTAIGQDLGCGMNTQRLEFDASSLRHEHLEALLARIGARIPAGRRAHKRPQELPGHLRSGNLSTPSLRHTAEWLGGRHLGTLGEGNHFVELQRDTQGRLWSTVHSGSRGLGAAIAAHHGQAARARNTLTARREPLPYFEAGGADARAFFSDLEWALEFARQNRLRMQELVVEALSELAQQPLETADRFDLPHNLITLEVHEGKRLFVHRKGAMPAQSGVRGIVPGSMGTASYIVEGRGHPASYASCSHGAGRVLSRAEAHRTIAPRDFRRRMARVVYSQAPGMEHALIEEAPQAYKDIKSVLKQQVELAKPLLRLEPLMVLKG